MLSALPHASAASAMKDNPSTAEISGVLSAPIYRLWVIVVTIRFSFARIGTVPKNNWELNTIVDKVERTSKSFYFHTSHLFDFRRICDLFLVSFPNN